MAKWVVKTAQDYEDAVKRMQAQIGERIENATESTMNMAVALMAELVSEAQRRAPIGASPPEGSSDDPGALRRSGYMIVEVDGQTREFSSEELGAAFMDLSGVSAMSIEGGMAKEGDPAHDYAFVQEVHDEFEHPRGGQSRYFESSVDTLVPSWGQWLRKVFRDGVYR